MHFQYPRTDRCRCNWLTTPTGVRIANLFQYPRTDRCRCNSDAIAPTPTAGTPFSILVRIDVVVTHPPQSGCSGHSSFQYPRTDRCRCNLASPWFVSDLKAAFSILVRIDVVVTGVGVKGSSLCSEPFSILVRIDVVVTARGLHHEPVPTQLSVSSYGSMSL